MDSGVSVKFFDDQPIQELEHSPYDSQFTVLRKDPTSRRSQLGGTMEGRLQGFAMDESVNPHLARISILSVSGTGSNLYSELVHFVY